MQNGKLDKKKISLIYSEKNYLPKMLSTEIALCPATPHFVRQGSAVSISVYAFCIIFFLVLFYKFSVMLFVVLQTLNGFGRKGEILPKMLSTEIALCPAAPHFVRQDSAVSISVYAFCIIFFLALFWIFSVMLFVVLQILIVLVKKN